MDRKNLLRSFSLCFLLGAMILLCSLAVHAETADDFELIPNYGEGSLEIKYKATGKHVCNIFIEGEYVVPKIAVEGSDIYFTTYAQIGTSDYSNCTLRCYNWVDKEVIDLVLNLPGNYWQYQVEFVYKGGVYMSALVGSDYADAYRYDMESGTVKKIAEGGIHYHYKQYVVCDPTMILGSFSPYKVNIYNANTGKTKTVMDDVAHVSQSGKYLYLARMKKINYDPSHKKGAYQIVRYKMTTGGSKTLVNPFKGYAITKITSKYIYYYFYKGGKPRYYRYTFKTKKKQKISFETYKKVMENS